MIMKRLNSESANLKKCKKKFLSIDFRKGTSLKPHFSKAPTLLETEEMFFSSASQE